MEDILVTRHGVPEYQCEGLCIHYHASPLALLRHKAKGTALISSVSLYSLAHTGPNAKFAGMSAVVVGLRESAQQTALPLSSHLLNSTTDYVCDKVTFDLYLKPAVPMALVALQQLLGA